MNCANCNFPLKGKQKVYCSIKCRNVLGSSLGGKNAALYGENHPRWNGGKLASEKRKAELRLKFPERIKARHKVSNAIRDGKLFKTACAVCGNIKVEGHHEDYSKPLEVIWLCRKHHVEADEALGVRNAYKPLNKI